MMAFNETIPKSIGSTQSLVDTKKHRHPELKHGPMCKRLACTSLE